MANICCSKYVFYTNDDKSELLRLHMNLMAIMDNNDSKTGCLDDVAIKHGVDREKISCRGTIENLDDYNPANNYFTLNSDTAWAPTDELWEAVIAQYKGISFVYIAEECGESIYVNTDTEGVYFPERYLLEICGDAPIPDGWFAGQDKPPFVEIREYFETFDDLNSYCIKLTGIDFDTIDELQDYISDLFDEEGNTISNVIEFSES